MSNETSNGTLVINKQSLFNVVVLGVVAAAIGFLAYSKGSNNNSYSPPGGISPAYGTPSAVCRSCAYCTQHGCPGLCGGLRRPYCPDGQTGDQPSATVTK